MGKTRVIIIAVANLAVAAVVTRAAEFQPTAQDEFVPPAAVLQLAWEEGEFTEGPTVDAEGAILFRDIGNRIMRFDPQSKAPKASQPRRFGLYRIKLAQEEFHVFPPRQS